MAEQFEDFESNLAGEEGKVPEARTSWFKRLKKGITTSTSEKKETPEGLWTKCPECNYITTVNDLREALFVCPKCSYHHRIGSDVRSGESRTYINFGSQFFFLRSCSLKVSL